jgi:hypothetical protein
MMDFGQSRRIYGSCDERKEEEKMRRDIIWAGKKKNSKFVIR